MRGKMKEKYKKLKLQANEKITKLCFAYLQKECAFNSRRLDYCEKITPSNPKLNFLMKMGLKKVKSDDSFILHLSEFTFMRVIKETKHKQKGEKKKIIFIFLAVTVCTIWHNYHSRLLSEISSHKRKEIPFLILTWWD